MTEYVLHAIRRELAAFHPVIKSIEKLAVRNGLILFIRIALGNACLDTRNTVGYSFDKEVEYMMDFKKFIEEILTYHKNDSAATYICSEISMIIDGALMQADYEATEQERSAE